VLSDGQYVRANDLKPELAELVEGIDETDVKILRILQTEGRIALSEIARRLDKGTATIHERTDALEEAGFIKGYRAGLDEEMLGFSEVAFVNVTTEAGRVSSVAERLAENPAIQEIYVMTGESDLLLKLRVRDRDSLTDLLSDIGEYDGVVGTRTNIALSEVKEEDTLHL
jgi:Lrp/AsnC family transcriptional regulator for asnA, asnC and gidA